MSSIKELLVLRTEGAREALEEASRESIRKLPLLGRCESTADGGFSVIDITGCGDGEEVAGVAGLLALK
jgi:hypothetical protein